MGLPQTGGRERRDVADACLALRAAAASRRRRCATTTRRSAHNWGTAETVAALAGGRVGRWSQAGYGQIAVGDLSARASAATSPRHDAHEVGLDADLRPMRKANDQCSDGSNWRLAAYDRSATRALIKAIQAATPGHVKFILFNDPQLIPRGPDRFTRTGHDDHLHVRLCEASYPDPRYRCEGWLRLGLGESAGGRDGDALIVRVPIIAPGWMVQKKV